MTQDSWPHDGGSGGTPVGDSGPYDAATEREFVKRFFGYSADEAASRGVMLGLAGECDVEPSSPAAKSVVLKTGVALVAGTKYYTDGDVTLTVTANTSGYDRTDLVILRLDYSACQVRPAILKGPEDGTNVPAALTQNTSYWEIPLARLDCDAGYSTITASEIQDDRFYANLPTVVVVEMTNNSGAEVGKGAPVLMDFTADNSFTTCTTFYHKDIAGVAMERIAHGASGKIAVAGIVQVMMDTYVVARGDDVAASGTAGQGYAATNYEGFGRALSAKAAGSAGLVWVLLQLPARRAVSAALERIGSLSVAGSAWTSLTYDTENHDTDGMCVAGGWAITLPEDGYYLVTVSTREDSGASVYPRVRLRLSTGEVYETKIDTLTVSIIAKMAASDYAYAQVYHTAAGSILFTYSILSVAKIGASN